MTIHREGYKSIAIAAILFLTISVMAFWFLGAHIFWLAVLIFVCTLVLFVFIVSFFRIPSRALTLHDKQVIAPADGKVVVIEETTDPEYFHAPRLQVSIFMSPANVHVNRNPVSGEVVYSQYHKGKYLVAWNPKSSTENERHSIVIKTSRMEVLVKQIAGALAKRIVNYSEKGTLAKQGDEFGFIKFGSRVDLLLPTDIKLKVEIGQTVRGGVTVIAEHD